MSRFFSSRPATRSDVSPATPAGKPRRSAVGARVAGLLAAGSLALTGCISSENLEATPDGEAIPTHVAAVDFNDSDVGQMSAWIVEQLNANRAIDHRGWWSRVALEFQERVPVDSLVGTLNAELRPQGPYVVSSYFEPRPNVAEFTLTPNLSYEPIIMTVEVDAEGKLLDLWYVNVSQAEGVVEGDIHG